MASDQTLKIGLVGCGGLGSRHAANVESIEGAELVAVCDHERDSAEALWPPNSHPNQRFTTITEPCYRRNPQTPYSS